MLVDEEEEENGIEGKMMDEVADGNELEGVELSMNSVVGLTLPKTMKVRGAVNGKRLSY